MNGEFDKQPQTNFPDKLGAPALRALTGAGYHHLEQLTEVSEDDIKQLHGVGPNALEKLRRALAAHGLAFAAAKSRKE